MRKLLISLSVLTACCGIYAFAKTYNSCPGCNYKPTMAGTHVKIWACGKCDHEFCYKCPGSDNDKKCPKCGHEGKRHVADVYKD